MITFWFKGLLRIDYCIKDQKGSNHAPIVLELNSCPVYGNVNSKDNEYCCLCGVKLIESDEKEIVLDEKLEIPKDKIILLDLNYTLIANSKEIKNLPLDEKIESQKYETELIDLIKDNYVILITASPYKIRDGRKSCQIMKTNQINILQYNPIPEHAGCMKS